MKNDTASARLDASIAIIPISNNSRGLRPSNINARAAI